jgi:3-hydroxy-9,10-secoandrosta-1,3,5(10)-triene-9,17-dione monooxygenase reductase component
MGQASALAAPQMDDFRLVMRQLAAGVAVVTAGRGTDRGGFTATSVISLSITPPRLLISVDQRSSTLPLVRKSGAFSVSFLAADQQNIAEAFAGQGGLGGHERFSIGDWRAVSGHGHELVGALANVSCVVEELIERHDHVLVIGEVRRASSSDGRPLVHWQRCFGQIGLHAVV